MEGIKTKLLNLVKDEEGLELSEYAVAGSLIVIGTVLAFTALADVIEGAICGIVTAIDNTAACPAA